MVVLALRVETPPTRPRELWAGVWGSRSRTGPGAQLDPAAKAELFATFAAASDAIRHPAATGPLPVLPEGDGTT